MSEVYSVKWNPPRYGLYEALVFWVKCIILNKTYFLWWNLLFRMKYFSIKHITQNETYYFQWNSLRYGFYEALVFWVICVILNKKYHSEWNTLFSIKHIIQNETRSGTGSTRRLYFEWYVLSSMKHITQNETYYSQWNTLFRMKHIILDGIYWNNTTYYSQ